MKSYLRLRWLGGVGCAVLLAVLAGCTGPITDSDTTPAGVVDVIEAAPKRPANADEMAAVVNVVSSLPGSEAVRFQSLQVQKGGQAIRAFCGMAQGLGARGELTDKAQPGVFSGVLAQPAGKPANVSGMLKNIDGKILAFDLRFGDFAAQRCHEMGFRFD